MKEPQKKNNILIVDDTPVNHKVLQEILTEQGYLIRSALSGEIALKYAQTDPPNLILLDIIMPGMDGYEVCRFLKSNKLTRVFLLKHHSKFSNL